MRARCAWTVTRLFEVKPSPARASTNLLNALGCELQLRRHPPGLRLRHDLVDDNRLVQKIDALDALGRLHRGAPQRLDPGSDGRLLLQTNHDLDVEGETAVLAIEASDGGSPSQPGAPAKPRCCGRPMTTM